MTSEEIRMCQLEHPQSEVVELSRISQWLQEIAFQLARMNERLDEFDVRVTVPRQPGGGAE